jgi:hypothetical protein
MKLFYYQKIENNQIIIVSIKKNLKKIIIKKYLLMAHLFHIIEII